ncbi:MAG: ABC transporter ATP-binding protein [Polyangiaceae bacterium]
MELVIEGKGLVKRYGEGPGMRAALDGVDIEVKRGEFVAVLGPSGCGKSTLLGVLGGLDRSFGGKLWLFGEDIDPLSDAALAALRGGRIGFVFQAFHLLGHLSTRDNILAPALFSRDHQAVADRRALGDRVDHLLHEIGLGGRGDDMPATMSGGERQRVAIARAMLLEPELLLCDEPTGNLDAETGQQIVELFHRLHRDQNMTVVAVTHELRVAEVATRTLHMRGGALVDEDGPRSVRGVE